MRRSLMGRARKGRPAAAQVSCKRGECRRLRCERWAQRARAAACVLTQIKSRPPTRTLISKHLAARDSGMQRKLFTGSVMTQIPRWVGQQLTAPDIARKIGCTVGTLRVRCSQAGISVKPVGKTISIEPGQKVLSIRSHSCQLECLPSQVRDRLRARAALKGISEFTLFTSLIETID